jgi:hypothetical protein
MADVDTLPAFDFAAFSAAVDDARRDQDMGWYDLAGQPWDQSALPILGLGRVLGRLWCRSAGFLSREH